MEDLDNHRIYYGVILLTLTICLSILIYSSIKPNGYRVYLNGESVAYVKNIKDFETEKHSVYGEFNERFKSYSYKDNISFKPVQVQEAKFTTDSEIKALLIAKSQSMVPVTELKIAEKPIGIFADEAEAKEALTVIHKYYENKEKVMNDGENNIRFQSLQTKLKEINNADIEANKIIEKNDKANFIILKDKVKEVENVIVTGQAAVSRGENNNGQLAAVTNVSFPAIGFISSRFGSRWGKIHEGIDIASNLGNQIYSAFDGSVIYAGWENGYGNLIEIQSQGDITVFYGHCSSIGVKLGEQVKRGDVIGKIGNTGNSTGPHLHFEVRVKGEAVDPSKYLK